MLYETREVSLFARTNSRATRCFRTLTALTIALAHRFSSKRETARILGPLVGIFVGKRSQ